MILKIHWHGNPPQKHEYKSQQDAESAITKLLEGIVNPDDVDRFARIAVEEGALLLTKLGQVAIRPWGAL